MPAPYDSGEYGHLVQKALSEMQKAKPKLISAKKGESKAGPILSPEEAAMSILEQTKGLGNVEKKQKIFQSLFQVGRKYTGAVERIQRRALAKGIFIARIVSSVYVADHADRLPKVGKIPFVHIDVGELNRAVADIVLDHRPIEGNDYHGILAYRDGRHPYALTLDLPHYFLDKQYSFSGRFPHIASNVLSVRVSNEQSGDRLQIGAGRQEAVRVEREELYDKAANGIHEAALKFEKAGNE
ncbi:MAG: hypothetical protein ABH863_04390 [Candidatus Micrarchaeota archaeon]